MQAEEAGSAAGRSRGGASNKYTFGKVSQKVFSQGFASAKCMYFCKLPQICFHRNTVQIPRFCKLLQICRLSQAFVQIPKCGFAVFRKDSQAFTFHSFASFSKV